MEGLIRGSYGTRRTPLNSSGTDIRLGSDIQRIDGMNNVMPNDSGKRLQSSDNAIAEYLVDASGGYKNWG